MRVEENALLLKTDRLSQAKKKLLLVYVTPQSLSRLGLQASLDQGLNRATPVGLSSAFFLPLCVCEE